MILIILKHSIRVENLKKNPECHIDVLRIDEEDNSHYVYNVEADF